MTSFYDVVVLGDELAGAIAAAHLARRGFRVLVVCSPPVERDVILQIGSVEGQDDQILKLNR